MATLTPEPARENLLPARYALVRVDRLGLAEGDVTGPRAEAKRPTLARHEGREADGALERAARDAPDGASGSLEDAAAQLAGSHRSAIGECGARASCQIGRLPRRVVGPCVARATEGREVLKPVRLFVGHEQTEGFDVMHGHARDGAALPARSLIADERRVSLPLPVGSTVARVPAAPRRILVPRELPFSCHVESIAPYGAYA